MERDETTAAERIRLIIQFSDQAEGSRVVEL